MVFNRISIRAQDGLQTVVGTVRVNITILFFFFYILSDRVIYSNRSSIF
jgi:hypothetical protein